ncbi:hypothetical protein GCM10017607_17930 [Microbacterium thalassium]|nr:hypothetical protein GCM10017607_17930 [Microbacterium thalassium]
MNGGVREGALVDLALRSYPAAFRGEYGDEMRLLARDMIRDARRRGSAAVLAARLRIAADLAVNSAKEHMRGEPAMRLNGSGIGYGIALALGVPILVASFSSVAFWDGVTAVGGAIGLSSELPGVHTTIALVCSIAITIGLLGIVARMPRARAGVRTGLRVAIVVAGATFLVAGAAGYWEATTVWWPDHRIAGQISSVAFGIGFVALPILLAVVGVVCLRVRALGALGWTPVAVAGSLSYLYAVMWIGMATSRVPFAALEATAASLPAVIGIWLVVGSSLLLGIAVALSPAASGAGGGHAPAEARIPVAAGRTAG